MRYYFMLATYLVKFEATAPQIERAALTKWLDISRAQLISEKNESKD